MENSTTVPKLTSLTMTGVDARTDLEDLLPGPEYAVLYTVEPDGRNRYPAKLEVEKILRGLAWLGHRAAIHVCGLPARRGLLSDRLTELVELVGRIQVNGRVLPDELSDYCEKYPDHTIITQHAESNKSLLYVDRPNHAVLVDGSGGRGLSPAEWASPDTDKAVGFAGGLGPDNLKDEMEKLSTLFRKGWWIDMEKKLRGEDDWFDTNAAKRVVEGFQQARNEVVVDGTV